MDTTFSSREALTLLVDGLTDPVFLEDAEQRLTAVNRAYCELVGVPRERLLGRPSHRLTSPKEGIDPAATHVRFEIEREGRVLEVTRSPVADERGVVTHFVGIIHDVTERMHSEQQLRALADQLEERVAVRTRALAEAQQLLLNKERLAVVGQLAAGLAHQIRNPLASISNAAAVVQRCLKSDRRDDAATAADIIEEEVFAANRIITDLLEYARIQRPARVEVDGRDLVALALSEESLPAKATLRDEVPPGLAFEADPKQISVALRKLLRNAFEAVGEGGTVVVGGRFEGDQVVLSVADDGPGLAEQQLDRVFEPLVSSKPWGLGLGLATARALAENHGGTLRCCSEPGRGACFELSLPVEAPPLDEPPAGSGPVGA